ncbi:hypothetical protein [Kitasatospora sp. NPDC059327]|uniref:hypothetical protein n=1 Tax=Kitasatospora sp. NPDC059327 TaxID=3346803 RepID=UPI003695B075
MHDEQGEQVDEGPDGRVRAHAELVKRLEDVLANAGLAKTQLAARTRLGRTTVQNAFTTKGAVATAATVAALAGALRVDGQELLDLRRTAAANPPSSADKPSHASGTPPHEKLASPAPAGIPAQQAGAPADVAGDAQSVVGNRVQNSIVGGDIYQVGGDMTVIHQPAIAAPASPAAPLVEAQQSEEEAEAGNAIRDLHRRLLDIVNSSGISPLDLSERTGMSTSVVASVLNSVMAPRWEDVVGLLTAVGHDPADVHPLWAAAHRTTVFGPLIRR